MRAPEPLRPRRRPRAPPPPWSPPRPAHAERDAEHRPPWRRRRRASRLRVGRRPPRGGPGRRPLRGGHAGLGHAAPPERHPKRVSLRHPPGPSGWRRAALDRRRSSLPRASRATEDRRSRPPWRPWRAWSMPRRQGAAAQGDESRVRRGRVPVRDPRCARPRSAHRARAGCPTRRARWPLAGAREARGPRLLPRRREGRRSGPRASKAPGWARSRSRRARHARLPGRASWQEPAQPREGRGGRSGRGRREAVPGRSRPGRPRRPLLRAAPVLPASEPRQVARCPEDARRDLPNAPTASRSRCRSALAARCRVRSRSGRVG